ncbi:MAG: D-Ala-D-Ala carboxypeptidase family metallohydrolase [Bacillota bacterium]
MSDTEINNIRVAPNFLLREFECKDGSRQVVLHRELLERLQALRDALGRPVIVNNAAVGGSPHSYHLRGMAADIRVPGLSPAELATAARQASFRGIIIYPTFVHVDVRP